MTTEKNTAEKLKLTEKPAWRRPTVTRIDMQLTAQVSAGGFGGNTPGSQPGNLFVHIF